MNFDGYALRRQRIKGNLTWRESMERREFLTTLAATSGCALAASTLEGAEDGVKVDDQAQQKYGVKITVLRRSFEKEFVDQLKTGPKSSCTRLSDNQEFTVKSLWSVPEKFCEWAWADIRTYIPMVLGEGNPIAVCCTDGFRPVFFKIERIKL
jgi:uncharacterized repeat protein (TIGR04076 family)